MSANLIISRFLSSANFFYYFFCVSELHYQKKLLFANADTIIYGDEYDLSLIPVLRPVLCAQPCEPRKTSQHVCT